MQILTERNQNVDEAVQELLQHWQYNLFARKPGAALSEDGTVETDLDLACLVSAVRQRDGIISFPQYQNRRQTTVAADEVRLGDGPRMGRLVGLTSNQETFGFGGRVFDTSVVKIDQETGAQQQGAYRTFLFTDLGGDLYDGWSQIDWLPTLGENKFLSDLYSADGNLYLSGWVHPNRWTAVYGKYYWQTKVLVQRLADEQTFTNASLKAMRADAALAPQLPEPEQYAARRSVGAATKIKQETLQAHVDAELTGEYPAYPLTVDGFQAAAARKKALTASLEHLRFHARTTELAFYQHARERQAPQWARATVTAGFKVKKTEFTRVEFANRAPLLWRVASFTQTVSAESETEE